MSSSGVSSPGVSSPGVSCPGRPHGRFPVGVAALLLLLGLLGSACSQRVDAPLPQLRSGSWQRNIVGPVVDDPVGSIDGATWLTLGEGDTATDGWLLWGRAQVRAGGLSVPMLWSAVEGGRSWRPQKLEPGPRPNRSDGRVLDLGAGGTTGAVNALAVGSTGLGDRAVPTVWRSNDGRTWSDPIVLELPPDTGGTQINAVAWHADRFVAAGGPADGTEGGRALLWTSPDGRFWTRVDVPIDQQPIDQQPNDAPSGDRPLAATFVDVATSGGRVAVLERAVPSRVWVSVDGIAFTPQRLETDEGLAFGFASVGGSLTAMVLSSDEVRPFVASGAELADWDAGDAVPTAPLRGASLASGQMASVSGLGVVADQPWLVGVADNRVNVRPIGGESGRSANGLSTTVDPADAAFDGFGPRLAEHDGNVLLVSPSRDGWQAWQRPATSENDWTRLDVGGLPRTQRSATNTALSVDGTDTVAVAVGLHQKRSGGDSGAPSASQGRVWVTTDGRSWIEVPQSDRLRSLRSVVAISGTFVAVGTQAPEPDSQGDRVDEAAVLVSKDGTAWERVARNTADLPRPDGTTFVPQALARRGGQLVMAGVLVPSPAGPEQSSAGPSARSVERGRAAIYLSESGRTWKGPLHPEAVPDGAVHSVVAVCADTQRAVVMIDTHGDGQGSTLATFGIVGEVAGPLVAQSGVDDPGAACVTSDEGRVRIPAQWAYQSVLGFLPAQGDPSADGGSTPRAALPLADAVAGRGTTMARGDGYWLAGGATGERSATCEAPIVWVSGDPSNWGVQRSAGAVLRGTGCGAVTAMTRWKGEWLVLATVSDGVVAVRGP